MERKKEDEEEKKHGASVNVKYIKEHASVNEDPSPVVREQMVGPPNNAGRLSDEEEMEKK